MAQPTQVKQEQETSKQGEQIATGLNVSNKHAGRLGKFKTVWAKTTTNKFVLDCLSGYKIDFETLPTQQFPPSAKIFKKTELKHMREAINSLLIKGTVNTCIPTKGQFLSSYFLRLKNDGSLRFILNLVELNKFI